MKSWAIRTPPSSLDDVRPTRFRPPNSLERVAADLEAVVVALLRLFQQVVAERGDRPEVGDEGLVIRAEVVHPARQDPRVPVVPLLRQMRVLADLARDPVLQRPAPPLR